MRVIEPGTVVDGRYSIDSLLGRGGFAAVYKAYHQRLDKWVALKVLDLPDVPMDIEPFVKRFMREAQVSARIEHANIVSVFDYGVIEASHQPYIAMEFLEGHDLEHELKHNGPLAVDRFVELFRPALDAIGDAHRNGVVHKDLKPSNLFVVHPGTPRERLVVLDFGIARFYDEQDSKLTQTGGFSGTPAYLAPEYIEQQIVSPRLDVYQMGLIGIEALIGRQVVQADNAMAYMLAHCSGAIEVPQGLLETEIGQILRKAISRDPDARYANGDVFSDALGGAKQMRTQLNIGETRNTPQLQVAGSQDSVEIPAPPSRHYYLVIGSLAFAVLIVGALGLVIKFAKSDEAVAEPEPTIEEPVELTQNDPIEEPNEVIEEVVDVVEEPEVQELHTVSINSLPASTVFVNDAEVGFTPMKYEFSPDETITVRLVADGYESEVLEVGKDQKRVSMKLKRSTIAKKKPKTRPKQTSKPKIEKKKPVEVTKPTEKKKPKTEAIAF